MKALLLARRLLWQNRWLFLVLSLWPYAMAALLLLAGSERLDASDVLSALHQECFYGLALVAFNGSALLGNEMRSRRIVTALARAVARSEYLLALLLAAWIPLLIYVSGFVFGGMLLANAVSAPLAAVVNMALLQLVAGVWLAAVSILFSVWLPSILASLASVAAVGLAVLAAEAAGGPGGLIRAMAATSFHRRLPLPWFDMALALAEAAILFAVACGFFRRRDLDLTSE